MPSKLMQHTRNTRIYTIRNRFGIIIDLYWRRNPKVSNYHFLHCKRKTMHSQLGQNYCKILASVVNAELTHLIWF